MHSWPFAERAIGRQYDRRIVLKETGVSAAIRRYFNQLGEDMSGHLLQFLGIGWAVGIILVVVLILGCAISRRLGHEIESDRRGGCR